MWVANLQAAQAGWWRAVDAIKRGKRKARHVVRHELQVLESPLGLLTWGRALSVQW